MNIQTKCNNIPIITTREQFMEVANSKDEHVFLIEKEDKKIYLISDMEYIGKDHLRIESMRFELFVNGTEDFLEETCKCRERNCGGIYFFDEDIDDPKKVLKDFYDYPANGFIISLNDKAYKTLMNDCLADGFYFILIEPNAEDNKGDC